LGLSTIPMGAVNQDFHTREVVRGRLTAVLTTHTVVAPKLHKKRESRSLLCLVFQSLSPLVLGFARMSLYSRRDMTGLFVIVLIVVALWAGSIIMKDRKPLE
jgi:hypothetical protein